MPAEHRFYRHNDPQRIRGSCYHQGGRRICLGAHGQNYRAGVRVDGEGAGVVSHAHGIGRQIFPALYTDHGARDATPTRIDDLSDESGQSGING